jgi:hypothetical protein
MPDSPQAPLSGQHSHGDDQVQGSPASRAAEGALDLGDAAAHDPGKRGLGDERYQLDSTIKITELHVPRDPAQKGSRKPVRRFWVAVALDIGEDAESLLSGLLEGYSRAIEAEILTRMQGAHSPGVLMHEHWHADTRIPRAHTGTRN